MNTPMPVALIDRAHAKLSASGSEKWLTCTGSAKLEEQFPDEGSEFAREGTFAHEVFENLMKVYTNQITVKVCNKRAAELKKNSFWSQELEDHVMDAVNVACERIDAARARCKDPVFLVEARLDFSTWVPEGFGTGDLVIITDDLVEVLDLKYGKGIFVSAVNNSQMRLYGLGGYNELCHLYDIKRVRMTVLQPRLNNYGSDELEISELLGWAENFVAPRAQLAWSGAGEFVAGEHCTSCFCRARYQCPARHEQSMEIAQQSFSLIAPDLLSLEQVAAILPKADQLIKWLTDVKEFAIAEAERGIEVPGYKLVEGRSNRKYKSADAVAIRLQEAGIESEIIFERSLLGITAMEKAIGKKRFEELLVDHIEKPPGKPTLVADSDKRPAISAGFNFSAVTE